MPFQLLDRELKLERFAGKGGWTYAAIPEVEPDPQSPFGWVVVDGFIDQVEFKNARLMPGGGGTLILPVNAALRKKLKKEAGASVRVRLYLSQRLEKEAISSF